MASNYRHLVATCSFIRYARLGFKLSRRAEVASVGTPASQCFWQRVASLQGYSTLEDTRSVPLRIESKNLNAVLISGKADEAESNLA